MDDLSLTVIPLRWALAGLGIIIAAGWQIGRWMAQRQCDKIDEAIQHNEDEHARLWNAVYRRSQGADIPEQPSWRNDR